MYELNLLSDFLDPDKGRFEERRGLGDLSGLRVEDRVENDSQKFEFGRTEIDHRFPSQFRRVFGPIRFVAQNEERVLVPVRKNTLF